MRLELVKNLDGIINAILASLYLLIAYIFITLKQMGWLSCVKEK